MANQFFIYYENWLDDKSISEKFNIDPTRIITKYDNFFMIQLSEEEENLLKSNEVIVQRIPNKNKLMLARSNNNHIKRNEL